MKTGKKGFVHHHTREQIRRYMKVPAEQKLNWLDDFRSFMFEVWRNHPEQYEIAQKFRRGEIGARSG